MTSRLPWSQLGSVELTEASQAVLADLEALHAEEPERQQRQSCHADRPHARAHASLYRDPCATGGAMLRR